MAKIIKNNLFWKICWLIGFDYSFILLNQYLLIYFIGIGKVKSSNDALNIYELSWLLPILISFLYFTIWHNWKEIFIKIVIFYLTILSIFDYQIRTIFELFSYETFWFIFSEDGLFFIIILLILMLISYGISTIILKYANYKNISNLSKELKK